MKSLYLIILLSCISLHSFSQKEKITLYVKEVKEYVTDTLGQDSAIEKRDKYHRKFTNDLENTLTELNIKFVERKNYDKIIQIRKEERAKMTPKERENIENKTIIADYNISLFYSVKENPRNGIYVFTFTIKIQNFISTQKAVGDYHINSTSIPKYGDNTSMKNQLTNTIKRLINKITNENANNEKKKKKDKNKLEEIEKRSNQVKTMLEKEEKANSDSIKMFKKLSDDLLNNFINYIDYLKKPKNEKPKNAEFQKLKPLMITFTKITPYVGFVHSESKVEKNDDIEKILEIYEFCKRYKKKYTNLENKFDKKSGYLPNSY